MAYNDNQVYAKYLKGKCLEESSTEGCGCTGATTKDNCTCCPPGLVAVYDSNNAHIACLTPEDAEAYVASMPCQPGYVKLNKNGTPTVFLGCVPSDEFAALYAAVNPAVV